ncbi:MAG: hypothetical protein D4R81_09325 [Nitrospiraceae bacterium]|nr:MAG: hypothetical protein D4R81_09325 [Nitrospiraceae bacterium]
MHHLRETRRSLIVSACLAALMIVLGVQYFSTRDPKAGGKTVVGRSPAAPKTQPKQSQEGVGAHRDAPSSEGGSRTAPTTDRNGTWVGAPLAAPHLPAKPPSPKTRAYLRTVRDLAENSLAQVEVMLAATDRVGQASKESADTLNYGMRQLRACRRQFATLAPPQDLARQHGEVGMVMTELEGIARVMRSPQSKPASGAIRDRLSVMHEKLALVLNEAEAFYCGLHLIYACP